MKADLTGFQVSKTCNDMVAGFVERDERRSQNLGELAEING
jgi:hypothetical protein